MPGVQRDLQDSVMVMPELYGATAVVAVLRSSGGWGARMRALHFPWRYYGVGHRLQLGYGKPSSADVLL